MLVATFILLIISEAILIQNKKVNVQILLLSDFSESTRGFLLEKKLQNAGFEVKRGDPQLGLSELNQDSFNVVIIDEVNSVKILGDLEEWGARKFLTDTLPSVKILEQFLVKKGGGIVLIGLVPLYLSGLQITQSEDGRIAFVVKKEKRIDPETGMEFEHKNDSPPNLLAFSPWFGFSEFFHIHSSLLGDSYTLPIGKNLSIIASDGNISRKANFKKGEVISTLQELKIIPCFDQVQRVEIQALWQGKATAGTALEMKELKLNHVAAFTHQYFQGRVYWQAWVEPNDEPIMRLFLTGVAWAAKIDGTEPILSELEAIPISDIEKVAKHVVEGLRQRNMDQNPIAILPLRIVGFDVEEEKKIQQIIVEPLYEDLVTAFINMGLRVVERAQLDKVIEEVKLNITGLTDKDLALRLGKLLPGSMLLIGNLSFRMKGQLVINIRILETQRAKIVYGDLIELASKHEIRGISPLPIKVALEISKTLAEKLRIKREHRALAVLPFRIVGAGEMVAKGLGTIIAKPLQEDLTTALVREGLEVVERSQLDKVLEEVIRSQSGLVDESLALRLGKFLPGTLIVIGSISRRGERWVINARVIETEKGEGIAAAVVQW